MRNLFVAGEMQFQDKFNINYSVHFSNIPAKRHVGSINYLEETHGPHVKLASANVTKSKSYDLIEKQVSTTAELKSKVRRVNALIQSWDPKQEEVCVCVFMLCSRICFKLYMCYIYVEIVSRRKVL